MHHSRLVSLAICLVSFFVLRDVLRPLCLQYPVQHIPFFVSAQFPGVLRGYWCSKVLFWPSTVHRSSIFFLFLFLFFFRGPTNLWVAFWEIFNYIYCRVKLTVRAGG
ncbi:hypothetical protein BDV23DRAFT_84183 [Aspergillus alliaceus]|uniref:Secreted protein n=1 Tax=Petromyces alliaceus TaxID=209559 RepID=A0A5N7C9E6_PETAA|nr:hypothetical protein BDV23DRAFT_84183 [Aspergillus alliaceus]